MQLFSVSPHPRPAPPLPHELQMRRLYWFFALAAVFGLAFRLLAPPPMLQPSPGPLSGQAEGGPDPGDHGVGRDGVGLRGLQGKHRAQFHETPRPISRGHRLSRPDLWPTNPDRSREHLTTGEVRSVRPASDLPPLPGRTTPPEDQAN